MPGSPVAGAPLFPFFIMSIAVSAVVAPSRRLRVLLGVYGMANIAAAVAVGFGMPGRFTFGAASSLCFLIAGLYLLDRCRATTKTRQIDISGVGQVRLTVQQELRSDADGAPVTGVPVTLLDGSTVWPQLMLLRLRADDGAVWRLPVLRDSLPPEQFRALAVALAAIGGRSKPFFGTHKIL